MGHKIQTWPSDGDGGVDRERYIYDWIDTFEPNSVFFDVGSCCGHFAAYAASLGHRVIAFEPGANNQDHIKQALKQHKQFDITLITKPVWNCEAEVRWFDGQPNTGGHHKFIAENETFIGDADLRDIYSQALKNANTHKTTCFLDQFEQADYIKIDVDGAEREVIEGAQHQFKECKQLCIEFNIDFGTTVDGWVETQRQKIQGTLYNVFYTKELK